MEKRGLDKRFLDAMREKLDHGRRQGRVGWDRHWENCYFATADECTPNWFVHRIMDEMVELIIAISDGDPEAILSECADVANFAMMLADVTKPDFPTEGVSSTQTTPERDDADG